MKWKSVLFSELKNKLGDQIVGTAWKGRGVFRAYKTPANPQTCSQQALRDHLRQILGMYQANIGGDPDKEAMWNEDALPRSISGYNLFMMLARSSQIKCPEETVVSIPFEVNYICQKDVSTQGIYYENLATHVFTELLAIGDVVKWDGESWNAEACTIDVVGTYRFYLVDARSKTIPPTDADRSSLHNCWSLDPTTNCVAVLADITITAV